MELFDRQKPSIGKSESALLVSVEMSRNQQGNANSEFLELANSSSVSVVKFINVRRLFAGSQYFIGSGKVEELSQIVAAELIKVVIFSVELSPSQQSNLEKTLNCPVLDRTGLILAIFALRANSFEGKLQVELAQLKHLSTRLIKGWTHLERQKGGIGLRGPGETQLETDKRLIWVRINYLKKRLTKIHKQRNLGRKSRLKNQLPMIALAGYTNAGKSTLFNTLTKSKVLVHSKLFATLDSTIRRIILPASGEAVIADTVGFIQNLPHQLIAAFKSTLEETSHADVLLHIVDATDKYRDEKITEVEQIIDEIGAGQIPSILVMNKIDNLANNQPRIHTDNAGVCRVWICAKTGEGIDFLYQALAEKLSGVMVSARIRLLANAAYIRNQIYKIGFIDNEKVNDFGDWVLEIRVTRHYLFKLLNKQGVALLWQQKIQ